MGTLKKQTWKTQNVNAEDIQEEKKHKHACFNVKNKKTTFTKHD